jgi:hypothetical protein
MSNITADPERFFSLVGHVITCWSKIDRALFALCRIALGKSESEALAEFYKRRTIRGRLNYTDDLLSERLGGADRENWRIIYKVTDTLLYFRNEVAHNPPVHVTQISQGRQVDWWEIYTEPSKLLDTKLVSIRIRNEDLSNHINQVAELEAKMAAFLQTVPQQKPDEREKQL